MTTLRAQEDSTHPWSYHVFLSFRNEDTCKTFTDHLYTALYNAGFHTFRDDDGRIERGEDNKFELEKAIRESRISLVVFSKNYAYSSWCLDELVMILQRRRTSGHVVLPVFYNVDPSHVMKQIGSFEEAFLRHEDKIKLETGERKNELNGKVGKWRAALSEVADLAGMNLQNQADGHEARFIQQVIKVVGDELSRKILDIGPYPIGIHSRAKNIQLWLDSWSTNVGIVVIGGMVGIGKTTIAQYLYGLNSSRFESGSFLANVREISKHQDGLLHLQSRLLSDILKARKVKLKSVNEGTARIKDAIRGKRVLIVLDDVDKVEQLDALLGMRDCLLPGSKIIITSTHQRLFRAHEVYKVHRVEKLDYDESLELFSWHAFGKSHPIDGYVEISEKVVQHCGGLPLAIEVLGSSLSRESLDVWRNRFERLKEAPDTKFLDKFRISYDSLQDDHDKSLLLHIACLFVGNDKDYTVTILDECGFCTAVGIQNLIDRCLLTIDHNKLVMHQLIQEMGREIVRQESPKQPGERRILWKSKDSYNVLRQNNGTSKIEGLFFDMHVLKDEKSVAAVVGVNRKRRLQEVLNMPLLSSMGTSLKRYFSIFSSHPMETALRNSSQVALEADAFVKMTNLKFLQLNHVDISGNYESIPKGLRWLCWHGYHSKSIPTDFPLESLVALDIRYSSLINVWEGTKFLELLKILNLSHAQRLAKTPSFSGLPNLERLVLENCAMLVEVHESIGQLERLVFLNLKDCENLRKLPSSIGMLKSLKTLNISGCSSLEDFPTELENLASLSVLHADGTGIFQSIATIEEVKTQCLVICNSVLEPRKNQEASWASLPRFVLHLSLRHCNLSDDAFPRDLNNLSSLQELDLSNNPICILPDCISSLTGLEKLSVQSCVRFRSFTGLQKLKHLSFIEGNGNGYRPIEISSPTEGSVSCGCDNLVEIMGHFNVETIGHLDSEIVNFLGLSNLVTMGETNVELFAPLLLRNKGCDDEYILCAYLPGSKIPPLFQLKNAGHSIPFVVLSNLNFRIRGLSLCVVYGAFPNNVFSSSPGYLFGSRELHILISNETKSQTWQHWPKVLAIPRQGEDMMFLSYWDIGNQLEFGDEIKISIDSREEYQIKEVGVHFVYKEEEQKSAQSTSKEEISQHISPDGNRVPVRFSPHPATTRIYRFPDHLLDCSTLDY